MIAKDLLRRLRNDLPMPVTKDQQTKKKTTTSPTPT